MDRQQADLERFDFVFVVSPVCVCVCVCVWERMCVEVGGVWGVIDPVKWAS